LIWIKVWGHSFTVPSPLGLGRFSFLTYGINVRTLIRGSWTPGALTVVPHRSPADVPSHPRGLSRILPPERLRWITFGHYEADECGAMNEWLAVAPRAKVAHGQTGCLVSLNDMADRTPQVLQDGQVIDLGKGKRVRYIDTPHIPHGWDPALHR
jgi:hypothetical protein